MPSSKHPDTHQKRSVVSSARSRELSLGWLFVWLFGVTLVAYWPALNGEMLWDDAGHVTRPDLQSWLGLWRIWFELGATQQYYPLLHSAFWVEHQLWGDATIGYHVINVLWHVAAACLFAAILRRLQVRGAVLAAVVFALHPVCVESVAWISEQKNTLSAVFYLAAALAWLRYEEDRKPARYAIATLWFVAALLTKSITATLPAALLVLAWWRRGRLSLRGDVAVLLPWLILGVAAGLGTAWMEVHQIGASGADFALGAVERSLLASRVVWFYFFHLIWPAELMFFYPRWVIDVGNVWHWCFPVAVLLLLAAAIRWSRRERGPLAAVLLFGGTLVPVMGFVNVYPFVFSYVADHFQYLASLPLITLLTVAAMRGYERLRWPRWSGVAIAASVLLLMASLTWRQSGMYRDVFSLYETTLERNPSSWVAHLNLGTALDEAGQSEESLPHLRRALELKPRFPETLNSLGNVLNRVGKTQEALPYVEQALLIQPRFAIAHNTHGVILMALRRPDEGIAAFASALEIDPALNNVRMNLGWALANQGKFSEAVRHYEQARQLQPDVADIEYKWGLTLAMSGQIFEALPHLRRAVELQPDDPNMRRILGRALMDAGRAAEAKAHIEKAISLEAEAR